MKKIILLCSIILCYMSSYATITLTASPSLTASGTSVTVTAHGETSNSFIIGSMGAPTSIQTFPSQTYAANMSADLIAPVSYYNSTTGAPFTITMSVTNGNCSQVSVVYYFNINVQTNGVSAWTTMSVALQVNAGCTYWNVVKSASFTRNNCTACSTGSTVTYTIPAHTYSSTVSQADADNQAQTALNNGGQAYANANGTCSAVYYNDAKSGVFARNNCGTGFTGSSVTYTVAANTYCASTKAAANTLAQNDVNANGQTYANTNGTCSCSTAPQITSMYEGSTPISNGSTTYLTAGGPYTVTVNYSSSALTSYSFEKHVQSINFVSGTQTNTYNNTTHTGTLSVQFYLTKWDSPPSPLIINLTNSCSTTTNTVNFYAQ